MHQTIESIHANAELLRGEHRASDELGRLTDKATAILRDSGGIRLLQAEDHGGFEADPRVFFEWVRTVARYNPSAGWVAGVVGVHPWEMALVDPRLHDEIYATGADTWVASPYAPMGRAVPVDGGFRLTGEWTYSTGTDHCDWVVLGAFVTDADGNVDMSSFPPDHRHFLLPRSEYEIVEDSWHVMGLGGTGSKNVRVDGVVVPEYRTIPHFALAEGAFNARRAGSALYQLPFGCVFSAAIASATFGIARGALDAYREYLQTRVSTLGVVGTADPFQLEALAEAEADLAAGISHVDAMFGEWLDRIAAGEPLSHVDRLQFRRNQVRAVQRVVFSIDKLFSRAGSAGIWSTRPLERFWRDLRTASTHLCNTVDTAYTSWADVELQTGGMPRTFF